MAKMVKKIEERGIGYSSLNRGVRVGGNTFYFDEEDEWFLQIIHQAKKTKFYGELNLKLENGVIPILSEVKKHKPKIK